MKEVIEKPKLIQSPLPSKTVINKNAIFEEKRIANAVNNFIFQLQDLLKAISKKLMKQ